jgi:hypothetical protein
MYSRQFLVLFAGFFRYTCYQDQEQTGDSALMCDVCFLLFIQKEYRMSTKARTDASELRWLTGELQNEINTLSTGCYPQVHRMLALNLTDAIIRHAVTLRKAVIDKNERFEEKDKCKSGQGPRRLST